MHELRASRPDGPMTQTRTVLPKAVLDQPGHGGRAARSKLSCRGWRNPYFPTRPRTPRSAR